MKQKRSSYNQLKVVEVLATIVSFLGMIALFVLLFQEHYSLIRWFIPLTAIAVFSRMVVSRSLPFIAEVSVAVVASVLLFYTAILLKGFPQSTSADEILVPEIRIITRSVPEENLPQAEVLATEAEDSPEAESLVEPLVEQSLPVDCQEGRCSYPSWLVVLEDVSGTNQKNPLKTIISIDMQSSVDFEERSLKKQVAVLPDGLFRYRFFDPGQTYVLLPEALYTFTINHTNGSKRIVTNQFEGDYLDIPRKLTISHLVQPDLSQSSPSTVDALLPATNEELTETTEAVENELYTQLVIKWQQDLNFVDPEVPFDQYLLIIAKPEVAVGYEEVLIRDGLLWTVDLAQELQKDNTYSLDQSPEALILKVCQEYVLHFRAIRGQAYMQDSFRFVWPEANSLETQEEQPTSDLVLQKNNNS